MRWGRDGGTEVPWLRHHVPRGSGSPCGPVPFPLSSGPGRHLLSGCQVDTGRGCDTARLLLHFGVPSSSPSYEPAFFQPDYLVSPPRWGQGLSLAAISVARSRPPTAARSRRPLPRRRDRAALPATIRVSKSQYRPSCGQGRQVCGGSGAPEGGQGARRCNGVSTGQ